jgi:hypothetical protein
LLAGGHKIGNAELDHGAQRLRHRKSKSQPHDLL